MLYLSKGFILRPCSEQRLSVSRCGVDFVLTGTEAGLWLDGRFQFADSSSEQKFALEHLIKMGLVECAEENHSIDKYRILCRCILYPAVPKKVSIPLLPTENEVLVWLRKAGLRLTMAELVCLREKGIKPIDDLLYSFNRQKLTNVIYTPDTIAEGNLELQMEHASARYKTVKSVETLLRKKRIMVI